ncbi:MAG TPA: Gfo/Idh/MocA family oxidoreductase [Chloroflexota bacterium]|nr:Gfo/Idh/MocA family oxidoreductase [Chloroflexota bacterium]
MAKAPGQIGFGIIGLGFGESRCAMVQQVPEARLVAVASRTEERARATGVKFEVDWYTDYHRMLERNDLDVVAIYTPSGAHTEIVQAAARAGKHVLTTKPLEISLARADAIVDACRTAGVKLATEFAARYTPANYALYRAVHDGRFGRMILGEFAEKLYRPSWYFALDGGWRSTWELGGGGTVMNQTIHSIDLMRWIMGEVETITARMGTFAAPTESEDTAVATVTFQSGALGVLTGTTTFQNNRPAGRYGGGGIRRCEVNGNRGSATIVDGKVAMWTVASDESAPSTLTPPAINIFQDVARWIQDGHYASATLADGEDSRKTLELVLALYESARTGRTIALG